MYKVKADLHIHTVLSPCADLEMSPLAIVQNAFSKGLKIIGITDHNSTLQCVTVQKIANDYGIYTLMGAEVTSKEEIHCLAYFETDKQLNEFQSFIDSKLPKIPLNNALHGFQALVDEKNQVTDQIEYYLSNPLDAGFIEIEEKVHALNGIFIPAHVDRVKYSLMSQLGYVPDNIKADALEIYNRTPYAQFLRENAHLSHFTFVRNSDAHFLNAVGAFYTTFMIENISFKEIKLALRGRLGRMVLID